MASALECLQLLGYAPGSIPPIGHRVATRLVLDASLHVPVEAEGVEMEVGAFVIVCVCVCVRACAERKGGGGVWVCALYVYTWVLMCTKASTRPNRSTTDRTMYIATTKHSLVPTTTMYIHHHQQPSSRHRVLLSCGAGEQGRAFLCTSHDLLALGGADAVVAHVCCASAGTIGLKTEGWSTDIVLIA